MPRRQPPKRDLTDLRDLRAGLYCRVSLDQDGTEKSVDDQESIGRKWADSAGVILEERHVYRDANRSASRFATKQRENFERLKGDIKAGELDVIWVWELSRIARDQSVFATFRNLCRDHGVLWVNKDRPADPADWKDMLSHSVLSMTAEMESEQTSERVQRGKYSSAHGGRRAGRVPYGYRPEYDRDGRYLGDALNTFNSDGLPVEDSPAYIVREIYDRIAAGDSITTIRRDLNDRGIKTQAGYPWDNTKIRYIAMSPTYIGQRVYQVYQHNDTGRHEYRAKAVLKDVVKTMWPPLVDEETFWAVQRILTDPKRRTTRLGPRTGNYLLTALARCGVCGGKLVRKLAPANHKRTKFVEHYACREKACVGVPLADLDSYVEKVIVRWLSDPATAADLTQGEDNSAAAKQARADVERGRAELQQLYADVKAGTVSARLGTIEEQRLLAQIEADERRVQEMTLPAVLVGNIGPQAQTGWDELEMSAKRLIVRTVADIKVHRVGGGYRRIPVQERVEWRWLLGDEPDQVPPARGFVPIADRLTLRVIAANGPVLQAELPQRLDLGRSSIQRSVHRLAQRGWVTQAPTRNEATARPTFALALTDAGRQALADAGVTTDVQ
jgi:site-specific DNA recombinase